VDIPGGSPTYEGFNETEIQRPDTEAIIITASKFRYMANVTQLFYAGMVAGTITIDVSYNLNTHFDNPLSRTSFENSLLITYFENPL
jgi:hypothetical protein